jgi:hypothetical protein
MGAIMPEAAALYASGRVGMMADARGRLSGAAPAWLVYSVYRPYIAFPSSQKARFPMNRRKKINQILSKKAKKANARLNPGHKPRYISKAERAEALSQDTDASPSLVDSEAAADVSPAAKA